METLSFLLIVVVSFLFVLTVVVFVHEMGHFLVARWCGVAVKTFSIGFGREIFGFFDRHGTRWRVAWIPLGGYVKFIDDENAASAGQKAPDQLSEEERQRSFQGKSLGQRAAIVAAGPIANFLLAILIFTMIFSVFGERITAAKVDEVTPGSAAERAGFLPGDVIVEIDGSQIDDFSDMQRIVSASADQALLFTVRRDGSLVELTATPERKEIDDQFGNKIRLGQLGIKRSATADDWSLERHDPATAFVKAVEECVFVVTRTFGYLGEVIAGRESADQLGGPIRIAELSGQVAQLGILPLLSILAYVSISIGLINLFPIPILDGGHLLFYAIEAVRGKPLSESAQEIGFRIGLAFILMLMIFVTWNDLNHVWSKIVGA